MKRSCSCATAWIWSDFGRRRSMPIPQRTFSLPPAWIPSSNRCWWPISPRSYPTLRPERDFRFCIAGDGPDKERFERRVRKLGLDAVFDFRGHVADLAPLYAAADVVILPSRSEGVPLVILEALASARCVIASKVGSVPEVLDSSCGILIQHPDAAGEFARSIDLLLNQPELRERMGAAGRRKMEASHDIRRTRETLASLLDHCASVSSTKRSTAIE